ncbi:type I-E CRISPR-associated protein Cas5/CasD [soil metagenome]
MFTLYAPLASWGDEAVGEVRGSWDRPSRSAILGLVAAGLGITREAEVDQQELDRTLGVAVRAALYGTAFVDYHTAQDPTGVALRKFKPATRRSALACAEPDTTLSRRTLRQDALHVVALWERQPSSRLSLDSVAAALRSPTFPLYAGRKANVLGLPVGPNVLSCESIADALASMPMMPPELTRLRPKDGWGREVAYDEGGMVPEGFSEGTRRSVRRRDAQPQRLRWQFAERVMHVGVLPLEVTE